MSEKPTRHDCRSLANLCNSQAQHINEQRRLRVEMGLNRKRPFVAEINNQNGDGDGQIRS